MGERSSAGAASPGPGVQVVVTMTDTRELCGTVQDFNPRHPSFALEDGGSVSTLSFEEVKAVAFLAAEGASAPASFSPNARLVTLRLRDETVLAGISENFGGPRSGVFLAPPALTEVQRFYIPGSAIRDVISVERLGDLAPGQANVAREVVAEAIERRQPAASSGSAAAGGMPQGVPDSEEPTLSLDDGGRDEVLLGQILVDQGFITPEELGQVLMLAKREPGKRLGELLVHAGYTSSKMIAIALSIQYRLPFVSLSGYSLDPSLRDILRQDEAVRWQMVPVSFEGQRVTVAIADPLDASFRQILSERTGSAISLLMATPQDVMRAIEELYLRS